MDAVSPPPITAPEEPAALLVRAGIGNDAAAEWLASEQTRTADLATDRNRYSAFWLRSAALVASLPRKPKRSEAEAAAVALILGRAREARERFLAVHAEAVYDELTAREMLRLEDLVYAVAAAIPGLAPSPEEVAAEAALNQGDKDGVEIDQGILLAHVLASPRTGAHLCHAMLLPLPESAEHAARLAADGRLDLGPVQLERRGKALQLTAANPRFLNAEDDSTLDLMETAVDVAILDPASEIMVLRGGPVAHPKYNGRRVFGAGINLTHLYRGKIPFVWFLKRDLGYVHKLFRGVARPGAVPDDLAGRSIEKPWIAAVDSFAIGGHCQLLLVADYVLAADDAFMSLPARKEGIIPGFANLRLPRLTGERIAREAILYERKLACDSLEGRLICDEIASADAMDAAIDRVVTGLTDAGPVSAVGNRRAFRVAQEPLDAFRRYASVYAREQAYCHFSPALIANLERNWDAKNRRP
ncbi:MAG TPA: enoyl-CoA hydratase/isomerase family protein [Bauldia sp.]|nr:enoyl-CoA hydratase/isomerase family protein [Bauldia sp.]